MSSSKINVKFQKIIMKIGKNGIFRRKDELNPKRIRKAQTDLESIYKGS